ncbi:hypothetical protein VPH35_120740 [Triticum aestivum]
MASNRGRKWEEKKKKREEVVTANGGGATATVTPMDCKVLPTIPGICNPDKCMQYCQDRISGTSVGECVSDGCQCTYCDVGAQEPDTTVDKDYCYSGGAYYYVQPADGDQE